MPSRISAPSAPSSVRAARYLAVSVLCSLLGLVVLGVLAGPFHVSQLWANLVATIVGTVPLFELNRRWVWGRQGSRSVGREVVPFFALALIGLAMSTLAVQIAAGAADGLGWSHAARTLAVEVGHIGGFGVVFVGRYVLLSRFLYRHKALDLTAGDDRIPEEYEPLR